MIRLVVLFKPKN